MKEIERKQSTESFKLHVQRSIRQMRQSKGLSQAQLAKKMISNVDQSTISNWESGKSEMSMTQLLDVLFIFGVDLDSYFSFLRKD
ncbi:XRE family transcriptional regulator [Pseudoalteromonas phenolica]|uniref:helix-turn-helix transcriptional regulator n=1 Tax=Pseudoalteromonas phenolica TaxID=161398 RepID=UPI00110BA48F|nr:helix-turn-helix transcriptional regulator [Pseudoalteromonas phenolica]TMN87859.1 XRE family transcriptional regulator [Pseudoalteromonas phenolica]